MVALSLSGLLELTKKQASLNEEIFNKRAILSAVQDYLPDGKVVKDLSDDEVLAIFSDIKQVVINTQGQELEGTLVADKIDMAKERKKPEAERKLPLFIYEANGESFYIVSVRGNGLWDEIWGNIAIKGDLNTVAGAAFDHKGETPGLGAEIKDNPSFARMFKDKKLYDEAGKYMSIKVAKRVRTPEHEVDAISGATVTCDGVSEMMYRGIKYYEPYLQKIKS